MVQPSKAVALNFLPLTVQEFSFPIFRKVYQGETKAGQFENLHRQSLPIERSRDASDKANRTGYWVSFSPLPEFEEFTCRQLDNRWLTVDYLYHLLGDRCRAVLTDDEYIRPKKSYRRFIAFSLKTYPEGTEVVWLEPYHLSMDRRFGFLVDFEFRKNKGVEFSRRVQQLSLSLDRNFRSNSNFYLDKYGKVQTFLNLYYSKLFPIQAATGPLIDIAKSMAELPSNQLDTKRYVFAQNKEKNSQYNGVKEFGPLEPINRPVFFYFMCLPRDTDFANQLFKALKGDTFRPTFAGMESIFGVPVDRGMVKGRSLRDFTIESFEEAIHEIKQIHDAAVIPILILPSKRGALSEEAYYQAKHLFVNENIPLQVVTLDVLKNMDTFKWSISNIGLQIFSKLGGKPWKVKPSNEECMIIGVGQSHDVVDEGDKVRVEKYFAYSVLTDSSGVYLDLEVLAESESKQRYLDQLKESLNRIISTYRGRFKRFVIHTPYRLQLFELESIKALVQSLSGEASNARIEFVVLKVNTENKFFGYDLSANSKVPFESTYVRLSGKEYLVWFEGLQYHNPNVYKRFSGPTHIEFYFSSPDVTGSEKSYLQDVLNLSGANWRGFNAKSMPVSILYCELVARFIKEFSVRGFKDYKIDNLKPWFL